MTKKRKAPPLNDEDVPIIYCWFCERVFADKMVLAAHQKAKHFTCSVCNKKLNSVAGLQNHLKTMHRQTLQTIANALSHRSDPETIPEISGMDGIPAQDFQEFKARYNPPAISQTVVSVKQLKQGKPDATVKKAKIDVPLATETIQAQLAEFQRKKDEEEIQELIKQGFIFPPGLTPHQSLQTFRYRNPPPGSGPFAAKPLCQLFLPTPATANTNPAGSGNPLLKTHVDGKSDVTALPSQSNSFLHNSAYSPKFVSKPAPPPSLKFTKHDTILSLSPPTPAPLAPGQEPPNKRLSTSTNITVGNIGNANINPGYNAISNTNAGFMPNAHVVGVNTTMGTVGVMAQGNVGSLGRGLGRGRGFPQGNNRGYGRANGSYGRGAPHGYQPYPQQNVNAPPNFQRGRGIVPGNFKLSPIPPPYQQPYPNRGPYPPANQYPPNPRSNGPPHTPPHPYPIASPYNAPPQQYSATPQSYTIGLPYNPPPPPSNSPPIPSIPFEQLYPMHGKKASDFSPNTPLLSPSFSPPFNSIPAAAVRSGLVPASFTPAAPLVPPQESVTGNPVQRMDVRIITDDFVSPEEKLAIRYGYGKS